MYDSFNFSDFYIFTIGVLTRLNDMYEFVQPYINPNVMYEFFSNYGIYTLIICFNGLLVCEWLKRKLKNYVYKYPDLRQFTTGLAMVTLISILMIILIISSTGNHAPILWTISSVTNSSTMSVVMIICGLLMLLTIGHQLKAFYLFRYEVIIILFILISTNVLAVRYNDLLELFVLLEMSSLVAFTLATFYPRAKENWESRLNLLRASEASLKYFIVSSFASVFILTGLVICVVIFKLTRIDESILNSLVISLFNPEQFILEHINFIFLLLAMLLILCALLIKLGVSPFDRTTIDTYDGVAIPILSIFAIIGKLFHFSVLMVFCYSIYNLLDILQIYIQEYPLTSTRLSVFSILKNNVSYKQFFNSILLASALTSLVVGSIGIVIQTNFKRFMAYSSISNLGFILIAIVLGTLQSTTSAIIYLIIYLFATLNIFIIFSLATLKEIRLITLSHCLKLYKTQALLGWLLIINFFSFSGLPPLSGFYAKYYILNELSESHLYMFWYLAAFISTVAVFAYLYLITSIYFKPPTKKSIGVARKNRAYAVHFDFTFIISLFIICMLTGWIVYFPFSSDWHWLLVFEFV